MRRRLRLQGWTCYFWVIPSYANPTGNHAYDKLAPQSWLWYISFHYGELLNAIAVAWLLHFLPIPERARREKSSVQP